MQQARSSLKGLQVTMGCSLKGWTLFNIVGSWKWPMNSSAWEAKPPTRFAMHQTENGGAVFPGSWKPCVAGRGLAGRLSFQARLHASHFWVLGNVEQCLVPFNICHFWVLSKIKEESYKSKGDKTRVKVLLYS